MQGMCRKLLKKRKYGKEEKDKRKKKRKKKEKRKRRCSQKFIKEGVQSRLPNEKGNREREHDTRSSWKMTLVGYNIWLMTLV